MLIILAQKTDEMLNMTDPGVQVFKRSIFENEVEKPERSTLEAIEWTLDSLQYATIKKKIVA